MSKWVVRAPASARLRWLWRGPLRLCCVVMMLSAMAGCTGIPFQEMSDARRALDAAVRADAQIHAPAALDRSRRALAEAETALAKSDYGGAGDAARASRTAAIEARLLSREVAETLRDIARARDAGRPAEGAQQLLGQAREAATAGELDRALDLLGRARTLSR